MILRPADPDSCQRHMIATHDKHMMIIASAIWYLVGVWMTARYPAGAGGFCGAGVEAVTGWGCDPDGKSVDHACDQRGKDQQEETAVMIACIDHEGFIEPPSGVSE